MTNILALPRGLLIGGVVLFLNLLAYLLVIGMLDGWVLERIDTRQGIEAQASQARADIDKTRQEIEETRRLQGAYAKVMASGFVEQQDRLAATEIIKALRHTYWVNSLSYELQPPAEEAVTQQSRFRMVSTPVKITAGAVLDNHMVEFWTSVADRLPGEFWITRAILERKGELTKETMDRLRSGARPDLVSGEVVIDWISLTDAPPPAKADSAAAGGRPRPLGFGRGG